ncbi:MAG TPA: aldo/keto reductase, partial [Steroidobacteraceae bacterium]|nr:aldo/keto reductase [Steroidobacteraceae bacterium]
LVTNLALVDRLRGVAASIGATVAQVAIAWVAAQGEDIIPLIGTKRRGRLKEALGALSLELSAEQLDALTAAVPANAAAGQRYPAAAMEHLDSER